MPRSQQPERKNNPFASVAPLRETNNSRKGAKLAKAEPRRLWIDRLGSPSYVAGPKNHYFFFCSNIHGTTPFGSL
jgi:hypothetical protein